MGLLSVLNLLVHRKGASSPPDVSVSQKSVSFDEGFFF